MKRLLPFIVVILALIGLLVGLPFLLQPDKKRAPLARYLSERLGHPVQIGKLEASFLPPTLRLRAVTVQRPEGEPLLDVESVDARLNLWNALRGRAVPVALVFHRFTWVFDRSPAGDWGWDDWWKPASHWSGEARWPLRSVTFHDGTVRFVDRFARVPQELLIQSLGGQLNGKTHVLRMSGSLGGVAGSAKLAVDAKGHFLASPQWTGEIQIVDDQSRPWSLRVSRQGEKTEWLGHAGAWSLDQAFSFLKFFIRWPAQSQGRATPPLQEWKTQGVLDGNRLSFSHTASLGGGQTELAGDVFMSSSPVIARVQGAVKNVALDSFAPVFGDAWGWKGQATGVLSDYEVPLSSAAGLGTRGTLAIDMQAGRYHFSETTQRRIAKVRMMRYFKKKYPGFLENGLPYQRLRLRLRLHQGDCVLDEALLQIDQTRAAATGRLDPMRQGMDITLALAVRERSPALLREIPPHYVHGAPGHEQVALVYGRIQGTWSEWGVRTLPSRKVPASTQSRLRRILSQK